MNKKKIFIITSFSLYGSILDNFNKIFNNNEVEVQLPFDFYYYRINKDNYNDFLIQAQAKLNIQNKTIDQGAMDEIVSKAKELKMNDLLKQKANHAEIIIPSCDQVVYITDSKNLPTKKEASELSREVRTALDNNKPFVNIDLQNLDVIKPYQSLYRLSDDNHFLPHECDFSIIPYHLYYVVDRLQNPYDFLTTKPYNWDSIISSSEIGVDKHFENNYCLNHRNHFERLLIALCCSIPDEISKGLDEPRIKYNKKMIYKSEQVVLFIDNHPMRKEDSINKHIEYAVSEGKEVYFIDVNRLKNIFLAQNPILITDSISTEKTKIKSLEI